MKQLKRAIAILLLVIAITIIYPQKQYAESSSASLAMANTFASIDDQRIRILKNYLKQYDSPLEPYAPLIVKEADENKIDWKLLTAISGVESTFATEIPYNSYNAWGWGIYGDNTYYFNSWEDAITTISNGIRQQYMNQWKAQDVYDIGRLYAASPTWAVRVVGFMNQIDRFSQNKIAYALSLSL